MCTLLQSVIARPCSAVAVSPHKIRSLKTVLPIQKAGLAPRSRTVVIPQATHDAQNPLPEAPHSHSNSSPIDAFSSSHQSPLPHSIAALALRSAAVCCLTAAAFALFAPTAFAKAAAVATGAATADGGIAALAKTALDFVLHLDVHLGQIVAKYGPTTYAILFAIVFAETGLVVTPFLPGDSLLFATGALAAMGKLNAVALLATYITAATLGDAVNYAIGNYFGSRMLESSFLKRDHIAKTEEFYAKYGGKTIILARFVPIVRTFAPFVAGVGSMPYAKFGLYNVMGAVLWTVICTGAGFAFGNVPAVHENFSLVVLGIVAVSLLPVIWEVVAAKMEKK